MRSITASLSAPPSHELNRAISRLAHREFYVLEQRASGRTLAAIGQELEVTDGRVRQIERAAKRRLAPFLPA
jgi:DNA-directed RNA polymerase sigma subunit (sigma70/sigma32)